MKAIYPTLFLLSTMVSLSACLTIATPPNTHPNICFPPVEGPSRLQASFCYLALEAFRRTYPDDFYIISTDTAQHAAPGMILMPLKFFSGRCQITIDRPSKPFKAVIFITDLVEQTRSLIEQCVANGPENGGIGQISTTMPHSAIGVTVQYAPPSISSNRTTDTAPIPQAQASGLSMPPPIARPLCIGSSSGTAAPLRSDCNLALLAFYNQHAGSRSYIFTRDRRRIHDGRYIVIPEMHRSGTCIFSITTLQRGGFAVAVSAILAATNRVIERCVENAGRGGVYGGHDVVDTTIPDQFLNVIVGGRALDEGMEGELVGNDTGQIIVPDIQGATIAR